MAGDEDGTLAQLAGVGTHGVFFLLVLPLAPARRAASQARNAQAHLSPHSPSTSAGAAH